MRKNLRNKLLKFTEITSGPYAFYWEVPDSGHQLLTEDTHKIASSLPLNSRGIDDTSPWFERPGAGSSFTRYVPLLKVGLHRKFARLHDNKSITEFANRYGLLGKDVVLMSCEDGAITFGESLERWENESRTMGSLLAIWDMVQDGDAGKLGQIIIWPIPYDSVSLRLLSKYDEGQKKWEVTPYKGERFVSGLINNILASKYIMPELLKRWQVGKVIEPAKYYVYREVNKHLEGHVYPQILSSPEDRIYLFPDSLLSALWVMFSMEITGNIRIRQCDMCGEWKELKVTRPSFYCSNACRQKSHYIRSKQKKIFPPRSNGGLDHDLKHVSGFSLSAGQALGRCTGREKSGKATGRLFRRLFK